MSVLDYLSFVKFYNDLDQLSRKHGEKRQTLASEQQMSVRANLSQAQKLRESYIHHPTKPMHKCKVHCIDAIALDLAEHGLQSFSSAQISPKAAVNVTEAYVEIFKGILEREDLVTTGVGYGVAFPQAKIDSALYCPKLITGLYIFKEGMEWGAIDHRPMQMCMAILAPGTSHGLHLNVLATYSFVFRPEETRYDLLHAKNQEEVKEIIQSRLNSKGL